MFYLIFGQAYSRDYLDIDNYSKLCLNKGTKIHMPKMKTNEDDDVVTFSKSELQILDDHFSGTNSETAYYLGRYCGLRINECYGLKWDNIDIENGTITIDRQMQYQNGIIKLVSLKTRNARRDIIMSEPLKLITNTLIGTSICGAVKYIKLFNPKAVIWCPFDMEHSEYVKVLNHAGFKVIHSHIDEDKNFFFYEPEEPYDIIISNPPFSQKDNVLKRLYELDKPYAMLLPIPTLQGQARFPWMKDGLQYLGFDK